MKNFNENKFYLLVSMSRSLDTSHLSKRVHLLGSAFYTTKYDFSYLSPIRDQSYLIIRLSLNPTPGGVKMLIVPHQMSTSAYEVTLTLTDFMDAYGSYEFLQLDKFINKFILDQEDTSAEFKELKKLTNILNNALFVFEDMNWFTLQAFFKYFKIDLSGGSISKRQVLSTAQYNLSSFLINFGYTKQDVYDSYIMLKNFKFSQKEVSLTLDIGLSLDNLLVLESLKVYFRNQISVIESSITSLEQDINNKKNNISSLETDISNRISDKVNKNKDTSSKRILKHRKNIDDLKITIDKNQKQISLLKTKVSDLSNELENLSNLTFDELRSKYYLYCHNDIQAQKGEALKNNLLKLSNKNNKNYRVKTLNSNNINRRGYSTLSNSSLPFGTRQGTRQPG